MKFIVGEYVERVMDGAVGVVTEVQDYDGGHVYKVDLGRVPGDEWIGTPDAWRPHHTVHAHVITRSRDCDGEYRSGHTVTLTSEERCDQFGDLTFKERVISSIISVHAEDGSLTVRPHAVEWHEPTDEGYRASSVEWCEDDCADGRSWQRDHRAEAMGY